MRHESSSYAQCPPENTGGNNLLDVYTFQYSHLPLHRMRVFFCSLQPDGLLPAFSRLSEITRAQLIVNPRGAMQSKKQGTEQLHFPSVRLLEASSGKHAKIVSRALLDLDRLREDEAIKIDLAEAGSQKAALRAALHRAARKANIKLFTTSDERYLYVFPKRTIETPKMSHPPR
jgi:hypothetical protein